MSTENKVCWPTHCPHLVNCSHAFWAQQTAIYNCVHLRRNEVEEGVEQKLMPIFWQGTPYHLFSWLLCDIAVDVPCGVSDILAPMNHAELLCIDLAEIRLSFFVFFPAF